MASSVAAAIPTASAFASGCKTRTVQSSASTAYLGARLPSSFRTGGKRTVVRKGFATAELKTIDKSEVAQYIADGYKVIDVRDGLQYRKAHIKNSDHVPLYMENDDMDPKTLFLRLLHASYIGSLYGNAFTKPNPNFDAQISQYPKDQKLLLVCQEGLRSGQAADNLDDQGWENVAFIAKGLNDVPPGVVEKEGPRELKDAGKGGASQYQQPVSIVVGSILITLIAILQFFPDQAAPYVQQVFQNAAAARV